MNEGDVREVEVRLAPLLHIYTGGAGTVRAQGATLLEVLADLDRQFPGLRFRVADEQDRLRRHMRCFVDDTDQRDLAAPLPPGARLFIVGALSGG